MNRVRYLIALATATIVAALLAVGNMAQAQGRPAPVGDQLPQGPVTPESVPQPADGVAVWQVALIATGCAIAAVVLTLVVVRVVSRRRYGQGQLSVA